MNDKQASGLSKFNLLLIIIIAVILLAHCGEQEIINYDLREKLNSVVDVKETVDFSVKTIQPLSNGFMLSKAAQDKHLTGIKFTGRIINTQSVDHLNVKFNLSVNDINKEFTINKISSGNSTAFNVYIPDISAESARYAQISYVSSTVYYYTK